MENEIQVINEQEVLGKDFKVYGSVEEPLFLARDVANWIEHSKADIMISTVDEDEKVKVNNVYVDGRTGGNGVWFLTENGLYEVLMQSRKPIAKQFKKEVKRVLKTIRQTGGYISNSDLFVNTYFSDISNEQQLLVKGLLTSVEEKQKKIDVLEKKIESDRSFVEFAEHVSTSADTIDMGEFAKIVRKEHIDIGRNKLFQWFRDNGYLMNSTNKNIPYQQYINAGYFDVIEVEKTTPYGTSLFSKTLITPKGQIYFVEKLRKEFAA